ncbi:BMP family lipoprotein [Enterocloster lavalensis]|uniref:BMP family lipoprotein n=1 Tax=Enterocloster lavalensis TaxID=460384 RepID=UPI001D065A66|nr:BMP family ABC transporter substrate-binding protein [Enterocloster lavalensis]MCB6342858.1 BMP family ABC transporter substrate-binding protein [Enterocloster lavalensis]
MRKVLTVFTAFLGTAVLLAGCASQAQTPVAQEGGEQNGLQIALITTAAGLGDEAWNDTNYNGVRKYADEHGIELTLVEPAEMQDITNSASLLGQKGYDLIFISENTASEYMADIADQYPDTMFVLPEGWITDRENVVSIVFSNNEVGFVCGAYAALMNEYLGGGSDPGWVGGIRNPILQQTEYSTLAGAKYVGGNLNVVYLGSYSDIPKAKEVAYGMYNEGSSIVAAYAGAASSGVYQAAEAFDSGKYAMGCATGQFHISPERIIASNVKSIDTVNYDICREFAEGTLKSGEYRATLENGGVSLRYSPNEQLDQLIPQDIKDQIEEIAQKVNSGEIVPPMTEEQYSVFLSTLK